MVKVRDEQPLHYDGSINNELWIENLCRRRRVIDLARLEKACEMSDLAERDAVAANKIWSPGKSSHRTGLEMAEILDDLGMDEESLVTAIIYRAVREGKLSIEVVEEQLGPTVSGLVEGVLKMAAISRIQFLSTETILGQAQDQLIQARKMLLAMVDDVRVVLIKLAERTCAIRAAGTNLPHKRIKLSKEVFDIYTPLAHRLGIGHLKWELEDLSFRHLEPDAYKRIADLLDEKRVDRQVYIEDVIAQLNAKLGVAGIEAEVHGRAKHIYSIWRKMKEKGIPFSQVYDVRAVRILVGKVTDCYGVLGVVHNQWHNIPHEFDDYIATPKENGYQSLHTAVIGPLGKVLEVQIRTRKMHEEAELGVCSHWRYKNGEESGETTGFQDEKINWLRQIIDWQEALETSPGLARDLISELGQDRIYVFTPEGHVIDMIPGATPVDFAYRVHTEVGHGCRGAKVNGKVVKLDQPLRTGDRVEILVGQEIRPRREWLLDHLGFVKTSRAKAKIQAFYRQRTNDMNVNEGRSLLEFEFNQLGVTGVDYHQLASALDLDDEAHLFAKVGIGALDTGLIIKAAQELFAATVDTDRQRSLLESSEQGAPAIAGVGRLTVRYAECCHPVPGDAIVGLIEAMGVVCIHRKDCSQLIRNLDNADAIEVSWQMEDVHTFPVSVTIHAYDRAGLLFDITSVLVNDRINMKAVNTELHPSQNMVDLVLTIEIATLDALLELLERIEQIPNVIHARRSDNQEFGQ